MYTLHYFPPLIYPLQKSKMLNTSLFKNFIYKIFPSADGFAMQLYKVYQPESKQIIIGPILVAGEHLNLKGSHRGALLKGDKIEWYRGLLPRTGVLISILEVRSISPSH